MGLFQDALAVGRGISGDTSDSGRGGRTEQASRTGGVFGSAKNDVVRAERVPVPTDEIDKYWEMYKTVPFVRASFNQFRDDIMANGYRAVAETDSAESYLQAWSDTGGVTGAERRQDIYHILHDFPIQALARGTVMLEKAPAEGDDDGERTAGVSYIHPGTVTPFRASDTGLLLRPDDTQYQGAKINADGEAAAYVQFAGTEDERLLTLDDVIRYAHNAGPEEIFGNSPIAPVAPRIEAVRSKLMNNDKVVEAIGAGIWFVSFGHEVVKNEDGSETVVEWSDDDMSDFMDDLDTVDPGDIEGHDGTIDIENLSPEVADIYEQLQYETHYILTAMPAPTYSVGFESDINQFVVEGQQERHEQRVNQFQGMMRRTLRPLAESVVTSAGRDPTGAKFLLEPPEEDSPILNLSDAEVDRMDKWSKALERVSKSDARTLLPDELIREHVLQVQSVDDGGEFAGWEPEEFSPEDLVDGSGTFDQVRNGQSGTDE